MPSEQKKADELDPDFQRAKNEIGTWFGQDMSVLVLKMKRSITSEDYEIAKRTPVPEDVSLTAFGCVTDSDSWSPELKGLWEFLRKRLVGSSGHPLHKEIFRLALGNDVEDNPPFQAALWANSVFDRTGYGEFDREVYGGLSYDMLTLLAPERIRKQLLADHFKGAEAEVAESVLWYEAIRKLILEFQAKSGSKN